MTIKLTAIVLLGLLMSAPADAQESPRPDLQLELERKLRERTKQAAPDIDLDLIMLGQEYCGTEPGRPVFSVDGKRMWFSWRKNQARSTTWEVELPDGAPQALPEGKGPGISYRAAVHSPDQGQSAYSEDRILKLLDHSSGSETVLIAVPESRRLLGFTENGTRVIFMVGEKVFTVNVKTRLVTQLMEFQKEKSTRGKRDDAQKDYVREKESELLRHVWERKEAAERRKKQQKARPGSIPTVSYPARYRLSRTTISPNLGRFAATLSRASGLRKTTATEVPHYVTDDGYVESRKARPKVGDSEYDSALFVGDARTGKGRTVDFPGWKGPHRLYAVQFSHDSSRLSCVLRAADNKRAAIFVVNSKGEARLVHEVHDEAWVRHVGDQSGFLPDNRFWFTSEQTGFTHLYAEPAVGEGPEPMTSGRWLLERVQVDRRRSRFLVTTTRHSPHSRRLEALPFKGGALQEVISQDGWNQAFLAPSGDHLINLHSRSNKPPELYIRDTEAPADTLGRRLTDSPTAAFKSRKWYVPEIRRFRASDGEEVPMRLYLPETLKPGAPAVIFVHGAGYLQNVLDGWSPYYREYMFHNFLRERGYVVADVDYRGSAGYGRDWRCAIYRHMGGRDLDDQVDAAAWLVKELGVAKDRIGLYGGSYGGFITLMALFTRPGVFQAGAALRPVTDWAHYNHGYTSNILNTPAKDPEAYSRSSPIHFAQGLQDRLLICHGLVDDNVQVQDTLRLSQRLIELRKTGWEVALYPVEPHGFRDPASWADEYKRIFQLFESTLRGAE